MFLLLGVNSLLDNKKGWTYAFFALAVGCRPFSAVYIIAAFLYFAYKDRQSGFWNIVKSNMIAAIPLIIIAIIYMSYNFARFGNPLEFGHNYLPEFTTSEKGQFSFAYFLDNLKDLLRFGISFDEKMHLTFDQPFCFLIANPIILVAIYREIKEFFQTKIFCIPRLIFILSIVLNLMFICLHRTLGAWQFGARYTCDLVAVSFLTLFLTSKGADEEAKSLVTEGKTVDKVAFDRFEITMIAFGVILNVFGATIMWVY